MRTERRISSRSSFRDLPEARRSGREHRYASHNSKEGPWVLGVSVGLATNVLGASLVLAEDASRECAVRSTK